MDQSGQDGNDRDPWLLVKALIANEGRLAIKAPSRNASEGEKLSERERRVRAAEARLAREGAEPGGRPRGRFKAGVPWEEIERAFVHGKPAEFTETGEVVTEHTWPTYTTLAEQFPHVSRAMIYKRSRKFDWQARREAFQQKLNAKLDDAIAEALALSTVDVVGVVDQYLAAFGEAVRGGKVRSDAFSDFDKAARLKEFLLGNADSRAENRHVLSLDELQARHSETAKRRVVLDDADTGMVTETEGIEVLPTPPTPRAAESNSADTS